MQMLMRGKWGMGKFQVLLTDDQVEFPELHRHHSANLRSSQLYQLWVKSLYKQSKSTKKINHKHKSSAISLTYIRRLNSIFVSKMKHIILSGFSVSGENPIKFGLDPDQGAGPGCCFSTFSQRIIDGSCWKISSTFRELIPTSVWDIGCSRIEFKQTVGGVERRSNWNCFREVLLCFFRLQLVVLLSSITLCLNFIKSSIKDQTLKFGKKSWIERCDLF